MSVSKKRITRGILIKPDDVALEGKEGEIKVGATSKELETYLDGAARTVVTKDQSQSLTNKTINVDNNTISNIEVDNLKAGVLNTSTTLSGASDTQVPSALAVKTYIDDGLAVQDEASEISYDNTSSGLTATNVQAAIDEVDGNIDNLVILSGVALDSTDLGTFTGTTIPDGSDNKEALQALETSLEAHIADTVDAHAGSAISNTPSGTISSTTVQAAINELDTDIQTIQSSLDTTNTNLSNHLADATDAHDASAISNVPSGNLAATDIQAAVNELQTDIDTRATSAELSAHESDTTSVHGIADTAQLVTLTGSQTLTNKTLTSPVITTPSQLDVKQDTKANLLTYATTATNGQIVFATDEKAMYQVVDNALVSIGGGGGQSLDTIFQLFCEEELTDWSTGDNATFLGGGTLAGTFTKETTSPLNGDASYKYTQAASSLDDYLASPVQEVPVRFRGNIATYFFPYIYDGSSSDIEPIVWDVTNGVKLTSSSELLPSTPTTGSIYRANVTIPSTCTQIRVGFQVKVLNSGKILQFDDLQVSSDTTKYANVSNDTPWEVATLGSTGQGLGITTNTVYMRRQGSSLKLRGKIVLGTVSAVEARLSLPLWNGTQLITSSMIGTIEQAGILLRSVSTAASQVNVILVEPGKTYLTFSDNTISAANDPIAKATGSAAFINSTSHYFAEISIPIQGWEATNPQIITASESFSTDTASLVYASSSSYTPTTLADAPIGTFITYTYAINTNTRTQTTTAPTQTTSNMNTNGIQLFARAYNAASTAASPAIVSIQVGKSFKGDQLQLFKSTAKATAGDINWKQNDAFTSDYGCKLIDYNPTTGILTIDAGVRGASNTSANFLFEDLSTQSSGYVVINASKSPAFVGVPQVQPRIATISDVKASGTLGGTFTSGAWRTRTLNTLADPTSIVVSLSSNQFTLPAGEYYVQAQAKVGSAVNSHKLKLANISDTTDAIIGLSSVSPDSATLNGSITITSTKVFELQHRSSGSGNFGEVSTFSVNEVYAQVIITKVK